MFRLSHHPSSGALKTVTATSGIGHNTGTATSFQRGLIRLTLIHDARNHEFKKKLRLSSISFRLVSSPINVIASVPILTLHLLLPKDVFPCFVSSKMLWYVYDVVRISGHAVSNVGVMDEWLIGTDLEESGRDPRDFLWRRHLPDRTTKKFSLEVGVYM